MNLLQGKLKSFFSTNIIIVLCALLIGLGGLIFGERMDQFGMFGDEKIFYAVALEFDNAVLGKNLSDYYVQRTLPSGVIFLTLKTLSIDRTIENVITTFGVYNALLMGLVAFVWNLISKELSLSVQGQWLGFIALFINTPFFKFVPYTQVTTDVFAYAIGLSMIYFYLRNNVLGLLLLTILGSFVWPTVIYIGAIFLLFKRDDKNTMEMSGPVPFHLNYVVAALVTLFIFWKMWPVITEIKSGSALVKGIFSTRANKPIMSLLYVSVTIALAYIFSAFAMMLKNGKFFNVKYLFRKISIPRILLVIACFWAIKTTIHHFSKVTNSFPLDYIFFNMFSASVIQPATFLVAHISYFGPIVILFVFLWRPFCQLIQRYGLGLVICTLLIVGQSLHSESRLLMQFYPLVIPFLIKVIDAYKLENRHLWIIGVISLFFSKFWVKIHAKPWVADPFAFPNQYYYMNFGPHMSHGVYAIKAVIILAVAVVLYLGLFSNTKILNKGY